MHAADARGRLKGSAAAGFRGISGSAGFTWVALGQLTLSSKLQCTSFSYHDLRLDPPSPKSGAACPAPAIGTGAVLLHCRASWHCALSALRLQNGAAWFVVLLKTSAFNWRLPTPACRSIAHAARRMAWPLRRSNHMDCACHTGLHIANSRADKSKSATEHGLLTCQLSVATQSPRTCAAWAKTSENANVCIFNGFHKYCKLKVSFS